jgi:hypothetical protein
MSWVIEFRLTGQAATVVINPVNKIDPNESPSTPNLHSPAGKGGGVLEDGIHKGTNVFDEADPRRFKNGVGFLTSSSLSH